MIDEKLLNYFESYLTDKRKNLFKKILEGRTRHFTVVLEDVFQPHDWEVEFQKKIGWSFHRHAFRSFEKGMLRRTQQRNRSIETQLLPWCPRVLIPIVQEYVGAVNWNDVIV